MFNFPGKRPSTLGLQDGQLAPCPNKPNCVCSVAVIGDNAPVVDSPHMIQPFRFSGPVDAALDRLEQLLNAAPNTTVVSRTGDYLHAEAASSFFGWVDDLEFHAMPAEGNIHVRSAARVGHSDFGVNRARVEKLRNDFETT